MLRGDIVKDGSGSYAVFTEQGSSASQMTAATVMDVAARLLDCAGQAADAVSVLIYGYVFRNTSGPNIEDPVASLERNLHGHPLAGLLWERQFEEVLLGFGWKEVPNWECLSVCSSKTRLFLSVYVDDIKMAGRKQNTSLMLKKLMKLVDQGEPTSFLDHVYLGCTQRECKPNETFIDEYRKMFESRISAGVTEKLSGWEKPHAKTVAWSYDMEGHAQKCVERYCEMANKKTEQLYRVATPC